ncbi:MAG: hypothetical protein RJB28_449 [Actinomycetota bacterium]
MSTRAKTPEHLADLDPGERRAKAIPLACQHFVPIKLRLTTSLITTMIQKVGATFPTECAS